MTGIVISNLSFAYPDDLETIILNELDLEVESGEFVCILGQSGCGKSTFLRLLAGLERPTIGSIKVGGEEIKGASLSRAVVFQDYGLFPWVTTIDNIILALKQRYKGRSKEEFRNLAQEALKNVGLKEESFEKFPKALSGGMKQRCAIARAFLMDSPILLMDEPFGALDAVTRARLQKVVLELWSKDEQKKTVFFITHDVDEALLLATRIIILSQSPTRVIFDQKLEPSRNRDRLEMYKNKDLLELQNKLVQVMNLDIEKRLENEND